MESTVWRFLKKKRKEKKLGLKLPYAPAIPLLAHTLKKTITQKDTCAPLFTATLFTIAKSWKQPTRPLTDEWIKNLWYMYTMEYYSAMKRNTCRFVEPRWINLESVRHSEVLLLFSHSFVSDSLGPHGLQQQRGFPVLHHLLKLAQTHVH